jgi:hypothetical protein
MGRVACATGSRQFDDAFQVGEASRRPAPLLAFRRRQFGGVHASALVPSRWGPAPWSMAVMDADIGFNLSKVWQMAKAMLPREH